MFRNRHTTASVAQAFSECRFMAHKKKESRAAVASWLARRKVLTSIQIIIIIAEMAVFNMAGRSSKPGLDRLHICMVQKPCRLSTLATGVVPRGSEST